MNRSRISGGCGVGGIGVLPAGTGVGPGSIECPWVFCVPVDGGCKTDLPDCALVVGCGVG